MVDLSQRANLSPPDRRSSGPRAQVRTRQWVSGLHASLLMAGMLGGIGCSSSPASVQPVSAGATADTLSVPEEALGGLVEYARVRFAGQHLSTSLVGDKDARLGDGLTLTVGGAGFAHPHTAVLRSSYLALPTGPTLRSGEDIRCIVQTGATPLPASYPGIKVDVGANVSLSGGRGALEVKLERSPQNRTLNFARELSYFHLEPLRSSEDNWNEVNWSNGAALTVALGGALPSDSRDYASIPVASTAADTVSLPVPLEDLTIQGKEVVLPVLNPVSGDVMAAQTRPALPAAGESLSLGWKTSSSPGQIVAVVEYFGPGPGRCPADCGEASECCQTDLQCGSNEKCEALLDNGASACFPVDGDQSQRQGALICTLADNGAASISGEQLAALNAQVDMNAVRGVVFRIGRGASLETSVADLMTTDGTRHTLTPVMLRASDVVLVRFNVPTAGGQ